LCYILIEFGILIKLTRLIKMCLNEMYFKVRIGKHLSDSFHIQMKDAGRLSGLVVRVRGYRSGGPGSIFGATRKKCSGSGTGSTQPREYN
jgi:hypothetical protein